MDDQLSITDDSDDRLDPYPEPGDGSLGAFRTGAVSPRDLLALTDLDRTALATFRREWPALPDATREEIVRQLEVISEQRVEVDFGRVLRVALEDPSAAVRQLAISALWEDEDSDLRETLIDLAADDPSEDVRAEAFGALARFSVIHAVDEQRDRLLPLLVGAIDLDQPYTIRRRALEALGPFADDDQVRLAILDAFDDGDDGMRASALNAMALSGMAEWLPYAMDDLASPEPLLRFEAARAIGNVGGEAQVGDLYEAMEGEEDVEVRHAIIGAIGSIGGRAGLQALRRLHQMAEEADVEAIDDAIAEALMIGDLYDSGLN